MEMQTEKTVSEQELMPVVFKMQALNKQHQHDLGICQKCKSSGPNPDLLRGLGYKSILTIPPRMPDVCQSLKATTLYIIEKF